MAEREGIYARLGREHQVAAQKFMFRFVVPLLCVVGPLLILFGGADRKLVTATIGGYLALTLILADAWRTRRGLPSFLWNQNKYE